MRKEMKRIEATMKPAGKKYIYSPGGMWVAGVPAGQTALRFPIACDGIIEVVGIRADNPASFQVRVVDGDFIQSLSVQLPLDPDKPLPSFPVKAGSYIDIYAESLIENLTISYKYLVELINGPDKITGDIVEGAAEGLDPQGYGGLFKPEA